MKTKRDVQGMLKRLLGNTGLPLKANFNSAYGGWQLLREDNSEVSAYRMSTKDFYVMLHSMNVLIETMRYEKKSIESA